MKSILITGGAGFIGVNAARHFKERGWDVTIVDNLSRRGAEDNLDWLRRHRQTRFEHIDLRDFCVVERNGRYEYKDASSGVGEDRPLDFHSPYGCSKGAADQYTIDYARIYGIRSVTFRQSCIYGARQLGIEDQGWVAWFTIAAILGKKITV